MRKVKKILKIDLHKFKICNKIKLKMNYKKNLKLKILYCLQKLIK